MLILGPFIIPSPRHGRDLSDCFHTGYSLEVCIDGDAHYCPLFLHHRYSSDNKPTFDDLYALGIDGFWPLDFTYCGFRTDYW
jgi:hypothetical protein